MLKKIKSKLKSKAGLTLTEMLITVILLAFFSSACLLGISTALNTRTAMIKAADSDILSSTVMQYISNEIRLSLNGDTTAEPGKFKYEGGSTYAGLTAGSSEIWLNTDGRLMRKIGNLVGGVAGVQHEYSVFNDSAYSGMKLKNLTFTPEANGSITCSFIIEDSNGNTIKDVEDTRFTVTPITTTTAP